ncbi:MAG: hypothetical protein KDK71_08255, partial [Chlamydiia bacterium]|nr:hypothetical protein [Chlamydiia bacterium]
MKKRKNLAEKTNCFSLEIDQKIEEKCLSFIAEAGASKVLCLGNAFSKYFFTDLNNHFPERVIFSEDVSYKSNGHSYERIICYQSEWSKDIFASLIRVLEDSLSEGGTFFLIYENDNDSIALKEFRQ